MYLLGFRHYEKATKFEKKYPTCFDKTAVYTQQVQNKWDIFSKIYSLFIKAKVYTLTWEQ